MKTSDIKAISPLGFQWQTNNPFLFCVHHNDAYPEGNEEMGPDQSLAGRSIGHDFVPKDGWRMYHGKKIPGFPVHPHRGFETITIVLEGRVDDADSMGASGRYGGGDVQWMTAGAGIHHTEMFPLLNRNQKNPLELFQIWLNLPARDKFVKPHYTMFWREEIPRVVLKDSTGNASETTIIAGEYSNHKSLSPPPESWASKTENDTCIFLVKLESEATWTMPAADDKALRSVYFYRGDSISINGETVPSYQSVEMVPGSSLEIVNGKEEANILLLQSRPINETVVQYGPFVMNSRTEIQEAFEDYRKTEFGGWPWDRPDQVHPRELGRFAKYADGRIEEKD